MNHIIDEFAHFGNGHYQSARSTNGGACTQITVAPTAPSNLTVSKGPDSDIQRSVVLDWIDNSSNETDFTIQYSTNAAFTWNFTSVSIGSNVTSTTITGLNRNTSYYFRIRANNGTIIFSGWVNATPLLIRTNP